LTVRTLPRVLVLITSRRRQQIPHRLHTYPNGPADCRRTV